MLICSDESTIYERKPQPRLFDGKRTNGLVGYMVTLAREEPRLMATLLHRVMQMQGGVERIEPKVVYESLDQVRAELAKYGIREEHVRTPPVASPEVTLLAAQRPAVRRTPPRSA